MKKVITLATIIALSISSIAEAKGGRGGRSFSSSRAVTTTTAKPSVMQSQGGAQKAQADATFSNTAQPKVQTQSAQTQQRGGSALANFATGAAAGYVLSEMLSPSEAQAQTQTAATQAQPIEQLTQQVENVANIPAFKAFDEKNPALIGKAGEVNLYCLNGAMYLINATTNQPSALVDGQGVALQCKTAQ